MSMVDVKNALAGNRTRVDNLGGYHSTSKLLVLLGNKSVLSLTAIL